MNLSGQAPMSSTSQPYSRTGWTDHNEEDEGKRMRERTGVSVNDRCYYSERAQVIKNIYTSHYSTRWLYKHNGVILSLILCWNGQFSPIRVKLQRVSHFERLGKSTLPRCIAACRTKRRYPAKHHTCFSNMLRTAQSLGFSLAALVFDHIPRRPL